MLAPFTAVLLAAIPSAAGALPVEFGADTVTVDGDKGATARGNVHVSAPPFYLTSEGVELTRTSRGVVVSGEGLVSFCPCLGNPLELSFHGATVAPPDDLIVKSPRLSLFGLPVAWLPAFWLRGAAKPGLLPPELAYRGGDGLFLGEGVHLPLRSGHETEWVDLRAGGYAKGGAAVDAQLTTARTTTHVRWDDLGSSGISIDARGAVRGTVWEVDALRGTRALAATTDLSSASLGYDRARAASILIGHGWALASGMRAISVRGAAWGESTAIGPYVAATASDAIGPLSYSAGSEAGIVREPKNHALYSDTRAEVSSTARFGAFTGTLGITGRARITGTESFDGIGAAGEARASLALPLYRGFVSDNGDEAPWVHMLEPRIEIVQLATTSASAAGPFPAPFVALPSNRGVLAIAAVRNSYGRPSAKSDGSFVVDAAIGSLGDGANVRTLVRAEGGAVFSSFSFGVFGGQTVGPRSESGGAWTLRGAIGRSGGLHAAFSVAERTHADPTLSRLLTSNITEPGGLLSEASWTGRGRLSVPLGSAVAARIGGDIDLSSGELLAVRGGVDLRDRGDCFVVHADAAHRVGRDGVDVWVSMEVPWIGSAAPR